MPRAIAELRFATGSGARHDFPMHHGLRWLLVAVLVLFAAPVVADQADERLDELFERLASRADASAAREVESRIWSIWSTSADPETNRLMARGLAAMRAQRYPLALRHFDEMVRHEPGFAEGWNKRATVLFLLGDYPASIEDIKRTLALERRHFGALSGLGMCYDAMDDKQGALAAYRLAVGVNPHLASIRERIRSLEQELRDRAI